MFTKNDPLANAEIHDRMSKNRLTNGHFGLILCKFMEIRHKDTSKIAQYRLNHAYRP